MEPKLRRVMVVVLLGSTMSIIDTTIVNIALDRLSHDLHTPLNEIQWVVSAYLLAIAAVVPVSGWAARRFGAGRIYLVSLAVFTVGSALCAVATTAPELYAFRVVQGLGGGLLQPIGMTILVRAASPKNLAKVLATVGGLMIVAPAFAPTLGALLLQSVGWQAIFLVNVPIGVVAIAMTVRLLRREPEGLEEAKRFDLFGLMLAASGTVGISFGLSESASAGSLTSGIVVLPVIFGVVLIGVFVFRSLRIESPLLDLRLYRIKVYSLATVLMFFSGAATMGIIILLPLYLQSVRHESVIDTGLLLIPGSLMSAASMSRSVWVTDRFGSGLASLIGCVVLVLSTVPFLFITAATPLFVPVIGMLMRGVGVGLTGRPALTVAYAVLTKDQVNEASPQINVTQRVGSALGTSIVAVVLELRLLHLGTSASSTAMARAFAGTYWWVTAMCVIAIFPAFALWRIDRRPSEDGGMELTGRPLGAFPSEAEPVAAVLQTEEF